MFCASFMLCVHALVVRPQLAEGGLGLSLTEIVPMVTSNCADMLERADEIGTLKLGTVADISVLVDERGKWTLRDNEGHEVTAERQLRPRFCLREGKRFDADALILPELEAAA